MVGLSGDEIINNCKRLTFLKVLPFFFKVAFVLALVLYREGGFCFVGFGAFDDVLGLSCCWQSG